jgi:hypothetical protein
MSRRAVWEAQRAAVKVMRDSKDTQFAAERRLYNQQLSELRKEWSMEALLARRQAYVAAREMAAQRKSSASSSQETRVEAIDREATRQLRAQNKARREASDAKKRANAERVGAEWASKREAAETGFREKWMSDLLKKYDVSGTKLRAAITRVQSGGVASWLTPDNFEKRLTMLLIKHRSPVDRWHSIAVELEEEERKELMQHRIGGTYLDRQRSTLFGGGLTSGAPSGSPPFSVGPLSDEPSRVGSVAGAVLGKDAPPSPPSMGTDTPMKEDERLVSHASFRCLPHAKRLPQTARALSRVSAPMSTSHHSACIVLAHVSLAVSRRARRDLGG